MSRIALHTFGCKINQYETQGMGEALLSAGHTMASREADAQIHLVNSCTVTEASDAECRRLVRRIARANPDARIVVTGCYAQRDPGAVARLGGVALVLGHGEKGRIAERLAELVGGAADPGGARGAARVVSGPVERLERFDATPVAARFDRTRAYLKIQDGCDKACGFCVIPSVRGRSRSRDAGEIIEEARRLVAGGYLEIVLTGIHLGSWRDAAGAGRLDRLVAALLKVSGLRRLRLSSLEPAHLTDPLLDLVSDPVLMPFFHLPIQAGDDVTLRRMRRGYTLSQFAERTERLLARRPDAGIGTDILVGYPGEDREAFERSLRAIDALPFSQFHVFAFSARPGTPAADLPDEVPLDERRERARRMRALAERKAGAFRRRFVGTRAEILVETTRARDGRYTGFTGNYLRVAVSRDPRAVRTIVPALLREGPDGLFAVPEAA